jgi:hypothetical protein
MEPSKGIAKILLSRKARATEEEEPPIKQEHTILGRTAAPFAKGGRLE